MNLFSFSFLSTNYESYGTRPFWDADSLKIEINSFISGLLIRSLYTRVLISSSCLWPLSFDLDVTIVTVIRKQKLRNLLFSTNEYNLYRLTEIL